VQTRRNPGARPAARAAAHVADGPAAGSPSGSCSSARTGARRLADNADRHPAAAAAQPAMPRTMQDDSDIEKRLTDLEIKASLAEDLVDRLNEIIVEQQTRIDLLARELARLAQQRTAGPEPEFRSLRDELPPHY